MSNTVRRKALTTVTTLLAGIVVSSASAQDISVPAPQPSVHTAGSVPPPKPRPKWETSAGLGVSVTDGNNDTLLFTANATTLRKWDRNEFSAGVDGGYGENDGDRNVGFVKGFGQYNYLFADRWFGFARAEALHDSIADIRYRIPVSVGIGYYAIKNDRTTLSLEAGPGYVMEKIGDDTRDYATIRFGEKFTHKLSDRARIWQSFEYQPKVNEWSEFFLSGEAGVEADITGQMALRVVLQNWYVSDPAPGREHNDLKLVAGIQYKFQ